MTEVSILNRHKKDAYIEERFLTVFPLQLLVLLLTLFHKNVKGHVAGQGCR